MPQDEWEDKDKVKEEHSDVMEEAFDLNSDEDADSFIDDRDSLDEDLVKPARKPKSKRSESSAKVKKHTLPDDYTPFVGDRDMTLRWQCPDCNYGVDSVDEFRNHCGFHSYNRAHLKSRVYNCLICGVVIENESTLGEHYKEVHRNRCFQCNVCHRTFRRRLIEFVTHYDEHISTVAKYKNARKCVHCGLLCRNRDNERQHMRRWGQYHTEACIQCDAPMSSWDEHVAHVRSEHNDTWIYRCGKCTETFVHKTELTTHR